MEQDSLFGDDENLEEPNDSEEEQAVFEDLGTRWSISGEGLEYIANWARFQIELHRIAPDTFGDIDDDELEDEAKLAYLIWFLVREAYQDRGLAMPGVNDGDLFPEAWDHDED